ncbi:MAG: DMT family transporter [Verrucomicrobiales bacterium]|nr:DMT family transporter [Verrucomicrobiales bacterium]
MKLDPAETTLDLPDESVLRPLKKDHLYLALFLSLTLWASSFPGIKASLEGYSPYELAALRFLIASLTLACVALWCKIRWPRKRDIPLILALALIGVPCYHIIFNYGQLRATAGAAAFIINIAPVFTGAMAWLFLGERITGRAWIGVAICLFGVWLIARAQGATFAAGTNTLILLVAAVCWSLYSILQKPLLTFYEPLEVICYAVWIGTLFLSPFLPQALSALPKATSSATLSAIYIGLSTAVAHVSWSYVLARMPASRASVYGFLVPLLSMGIAFVWIHETPNLFLLIGGTVVLCGVTVATRPMDRGESP